MDFSESINCCLSSDEVLQIIDPVSPDHLSIADRYRGIWEGYWASRNDMDKQRLINHERIEQVGVETEHADVPGSMVIRFQVIGA